MLNIDFKKVFSLFSIIILIIFISGVTFSIGDSGGDSGDSSDSGDSDSSDDGEDFGGYGSIDGVSDAVSDFESNLDKEGNTGGGKSSKESYEDKANNEAKSTEVGVKGVFGVGEDDNADSVDALGKDWGGENDEVNSKSGGFLEGLKDFGKELFGISSKEDPNDPNEEKSLGGKIGSFFNTVVSFTPVGIAATAITTVAALAGFKTNSALGIAVETLVGHEKAENLPTRIESAYGMKTSKAFNDLVAPIEKPVTFGGNEIASPSYS